MMMNISCILGLKFKNWISFAAIYEDDILNFASDLQDLMKVMKHIF